MKFKKFISRIIIAVLVLGLFNVEAFGTINSYAAEDKVSVTYQAHSQSFGWLPWVSDGVDAGTEGLGKRMEGIRIKLDSSIPGDIHYEVHCQTYGWLPAVKNGEMAGTEGESKRLEAMKVYLTGEIAEKYDVYYRTHCQSYGWLDWVKNGELSGTEGESKRLEAYEIKLVPKEGTNPGGGNTSHVDPIPSSTNVELTYRTHCQTYGWLDYVNGGYMSGTEGESKRLEGIEIAVKSKISGGITYRTHTQSYGWLPWVKNNEMAGIIGQSKRMEALQIKLTGNLKKKYDIYYRVHVQSYGWLDWARNGAYAGTAGYSKRLEAIQIVIKKKGTKAPGETKMPFISPDGSGIIGEDDDTNPDPNPDPDPNIDEHDDTSGRSAKKILNSAELKYHAKTGDPIVDNKVNSILSQIISDDMSTYEKTKAIYDWIIANNRYKVDYGGWRISKSYQSIFDTWCANQAYSSLLLGYGSCKNYSAAFVVMTRAIGLDSFKVCGLAPGQNAANGDEHGWAVVRIDGKYYHFDPQLGDTADGGGYGNTYDYFCKTNSQFKSMGFQLCGDGDGSFEDYINGFNYFR